MHFYSKVHCFIISVLISFFLVSYLPYTSIVFMMRGNLPTAITIKQSASRLVCFCFNLFLSFVSVSLLLQVNFFVTNRRTALPHSLFRRLSRTQFRFLPRQCAFGVWSEIGLFFRFLAHCCPVNGASGTTDKNKLLLLLKPMERH